MSFTTSTLAAGGALGNVTPAVDDISGALYQRGKAANPNADQTGAYGIDSDPVRVRHRRRGTSDYDSGTFAVTNGSPASVTTSTIYPEGGTITNTDAAAHLVTWTNTANDVLGNVVVQAKETIPWPLPNAGSFVGLKIGADGDGVRAQIAGGQ